MQGRGFEPLKAEPAGLQPAPFGHSGTPARLRSVARPPQAVTTSRATRARLPTVALLAQLVEHLHGKEGVAGSSPAEGFTKREASQLTSDRSDRAGIRSSMAFATFWVTLERPSCSFSASR